MSEMWILFGPTYRLPLAVEWPDQRQVIARVEPHPETPWLECWKATVLERVREVGGWEETEGRLRWFVTKEALEEMAARVRAGVTAEEVVQWSPDRSIFELPSDNPLDYDEAGALARRRFLMEFVNTVGLSVFENLEELEVFYQLLRNFMMTWLLERNECLDLGFARMFVTPFWPGWEDRMRALKRLGKLRLAKKIYADRLRYFDMETKTEVRCLVTSMTKEWLRVARAGEVLRRRHMSDWKYMKWVDNRHKQVLPWAVEHVLATWQKANMQDMEHMYPYLRRRFSTGEIERRQWRADKTNLGKDTHGLEEHRKKLRWRHRIGCGPIVESENEVMLPVRDLQPPAEDLRDAGGNVAEPADGTTGAKGMPVQHGVEGAVSGGEVLEPGAGERAGVAGSADEGKGTLTTDFTDFTDFTDGGRKE